MSNPHEEFERYKASVPGKTIQVEYAVGGPGGGTSMFVINRVVWYAVRQFSFDDQKKVKVEKIGEALSLEGAQELVRKRKEGAPASCTYNKLPNDAVSNPSKYFRAGDQVAVLRGKIPFLNAGIYFHHGIYLSGGNVAHLHAEKEKDGASHSTLLQEKRQTCALITNWGEFISTSTQVCKVKWSPSNPASEIVKRAEEAVAQKKGFGDYSLFSRNCEHFASWCCTGREYSMQWGQLYEPAGRGTEPKDKGSEWKWYEVAAAPFVVVGVALAATVVVPLVLLDATLIRPKKYQSLCAKVGGQDEDDY